MNNRFSFYGRELAAVKNGNLYMPRAVKSFYESDADYVLVKDVDEPCNYLTVHPTDEFRIKPDVKIVPEGNKPYEQLEKLVVNGTTKGLKLHDDYIRYLGIGKESQVLLVGYGSNFGIWKPKDFVKIDSSVSNEEIRAVLFEAGIK